MGDFDRRAGELLEQRLQLVGLKQRHAQLLKAGEGAKILRQAFVQRLHLFARRAPQAFQAERGLDARYASEEPILNG